MLFAENKRWSPLSPISAPRLPSHSPERVSQTTQWNPPFMQQPLSQPPGSPPSYAQQPVGPAVGGGGDYPGQYPAGYGGMQPQQPHPQQQLAPGMYASYPQQPMGGYPIGGYPDQTQPPLQQQQHPMGGIPGQLSAQQLQYQPQYQQQEQVLFR